MNRGGDDGGSWSRSGGGFDGSFGGDVLELIINLLHVLGDAEDLSFDSERSVVSIVLDPAGSMSQQESNRSQFRETYF